MSGVIAVIPRHPASLRICLPVSVAETPSMALNFRRSFAAPAGRVVFTDVTASPTAAERVPRPPCTTTRNVASGCAVAASSKLCGTVGLLAGRVPACAVVAPAPAVAMSVSATTSVPTSAAIRGNSSRFNCSSLLVMRMNARRSTGLLRASIPSHLHPAPEVCSPDSIRESQRMSAARFTPYVAPDGAISPVGVNVLRSNRCLASPLRRLRRARARTRAGSPARSRAAVGDGLPSWGRPTSSGRTARARRASGCCG